MKDLKVVFMGTPYFSVPILENLIKNTNVIGVVTSPDAFVGRKKILTPCPVKKLAQENNIPVFSPEKIRSDYDFLLKLNPDIIITCAYGQIVPEEVLNIPKLGCINIHASLLPKYRGGAPIHHAIMNNEKWTGITLMYMDKGMDTGDIITSSKVEITNDDNLETLSNKLSNLGSAMIIENLPSIINHTNHREKQNNEEATFAKIIKREDEHLNFNDTAINIYNKVRALSPSPLAYFIMDDVEYKIGKCEIVKGEGNVGTIIKEDKESFVIKAIDDAIKITQIKPKGKTLMSVKDFKNGYQKILLNKEVS